MAILARPLPPSLKNHEVEFVVPIYSCIEQRVTPEEIAAIAIALSEQVADQSNQQPYSLWGIQGRLEALVKV